MATRIDPNVLAHLEWLGFVRPTGLVVSAPALVQRGVILPRDPEGQRALIACTEERAFDPREPDRMSRYASDFREFAAGVLDWSFDAASYACDGGAPIPAELEVPLPDLGETIRPDFAVREPDPRDGVSPWQLLVRNVDLGADFDARGEEINEQSRMERLLRATGVLAGVIFNGRTLRLVSAPVGESSGWLDFHIDDMALTAGRPICAAMRLLLKEERLLAMPRAERLPALLDDSRKFQNTVSERLAEQVLHALYELLRGLQAAHDRTGGELLRELLDDDPRNGRADDIYRALLTVILRLVFLLYAEEREMLPGDQTFSRYYSLAGLYDRLREDASLYPDTMDQRFGAWPQLLALFRMLFDGAVYGDTKLPARHGTLFDPDRFPFLEGRPPGHHRQKHERIEAPLVPDGAVHRALEDLLIFDGERISYRALDVEQIGSVYQTMMGFKLEKAAGLSVAIKSQKKQGAPTTINLEALVAEPSPRRERWLQDNAHRKFAPGVARNVAAASSIEDLHAALDGVIDKAATPDLAPAGAMVLQPSEERRRSGSHYTPRELTEPIVRTTLEPILARLRGDDGGPPLPEQILDLKVCDPALGSGAFLVEACRQLGAALLESWRHYDSLPAIPADEDEEVYARRMVAQRCLYGVDRNPVAVDLAKVSLWLITLAKDHAFTFLDHALRHGDSLVGLSRKQIEAFHWDPDAKPQRGFEVMRIGEHVAKAAELRRQIREADETVTDQEQRFMLDEADTELAHARLFGDLVLAAFFQGDNARERDNKRLAYADDVSHGRAEQHRTVLADMRDDARPIVPFHWEIEFPEVFDRMNPGFDAFVGNPPFMGGSKISSAAGDDYLRWILQLHAGSHGNGDLVAHFFRRAFHLLRIGSALGLIATNTIGQGDTRTTGLRQICRDGGTIFSARRRVKWPGLAAVVVSIVHVAKGMNFGEKLLDNRSVHTITAYLFYRGSNENPFSLGENVSLAFHGSKIYGSGFTFDDTGMDGSVTSVTQMHRLIHAQPRNQEVIFPYMGGDEVNTSPTHQHDRYVINFGDRTEAECRQNWPKLMAIVEAKVRPERMAGSLRDYPWWMYERIRPELYASIAPLQRVLVVCRHQPQWGLALLQSRAVFADSLIIFPLDTSAAFCALQARPHEIWARFFGSSLEDRLRYTPSDCFETFPFPKDWQTHPALEATGKEYYEFRADLMVRNDEGLTKTYNRFHDPYESSPDIVKLRELHAAMDRAVLDAYGWSDSLHGLRIPPGLRDRRGGMGQQEEALPLPLARRRPRRNPRAPPRAEREARGGGAGLRRRCRAASTQDHIETRGEEDIALHRRASITEAAMTTQTDPDPAVVVPATSAEVRERLAQALELDLVGPWPGHEFADERLRARDRPSNFYLTGFLIPDGTQPERAGDADEDDDVDEVQLNLGLIEESNEDRKARKKGYFPSSMGISFLVPNDTTELKVQVTWGDYARIEDPEEDDDDDGVPDLVWQRTPREETLPVTLTGEYERAPINVPNSGGLQLYVIEQAITAPELAEHIPTGTRSVSLFLVNHREPIEDERLEREAKASPAADGAAAEDGALQAGAEAQEEPAPRAIPASADTAYAFQPRIEVRCDGFVARPDLHGINAQTYDELLADLHYADTPEYATGHGVSAAWQVDGDGCTIVRTAWTPSAHVEKTNTVAVAGVELSMDALGDLADGAAASAALDALVGEYRGWIERQHADITSLQGRRHETAEELLRLAGIAATRIERGIETLATDADALDAFRMANRAVARALRQRLPDQFATEPPRWRAFQLAFILLNLPGLADPADPHRNTVDLLFFPTGGGKTEAYLGLAAFAMVLRRLRNPGDNGLAGAGVSVIMRYTLRLLTLDQLQRAAGLVCALELEREGNPARYGSWPFEIGLWVGKAATPNVMGHRNDGRQDTARTKVNQFKSDPGRYPSPIPLENCPWCGTRFSANSFTLRPDSDRPRDLRIVCANAQCDFTRDRALPIVAVDEPLYRRLPAFLIATLDKFATLPWVGQSGALLTGADRHDDSGFYGGSEPGKGTRLAAPLPPPDLVIQDELHLISGPLGTMAGLYEAAIEALACREIDGVGTVHPKIVASTATVRRAQNQIQALFGRSIAQVFPPPGPNRRDSFFAATESSLEIARQYIGVAAQGRNPKVVMRRVWLALMCAAERAYRDAGGERNADNVADPYMTVISYFNSLRELGGARRIYEEEVQHAAQTYGAKKRLGQRFGLFQDRKRMRAEPTELTSRVSTSKVAEARRKLEAKFDDRDNRVDCAIATNMISVGLDIPRLGLMVVLGQPKAHAEYIQATSRVGRDDARPGLVVTLLNVHKPRDRSHFERFRHYHETFYRSVEVSSVTPFSARAMDRGFAGALVALARHIDGALTPARGVERIKDVRTALRDRLLAVFRERVANQPMDEDERAERERSVQDRIGDLLDAWTKIFDDLHDAGVQMQYQQYELDRVPGHLLHEMLDVNLTAYEEKFRANRSLRDVEPPVNLFLKDLSGADVDVDP